MERMTPAEMDVLAEKIAQHIDMHVCKFQDEEISELKNIAKTFKSMRSTAIATAVGFFVLTILGLLGAGIIFRFTGK